MIELEQQQCRPSTTRIFQSTEASKGEHAVELLCQPHAHCQLPPLGQSIEDIHLLRPPTRSRFSQLRSGLPLALQRLTAVELGRLERWALSHVKMQYISACAETNFMSSLTCHKHNVSRKMTSMCELLRQLAGGACLTDDQHHFMFELLQSLPLLNSFPTAILLAVVTKLRVVSRTQQIEIFQQGQSAEGIYVLVQGLVELRGGCEAPSVLKRAPAAILPNDVLEYLPMQFEVREPMKRRWSCTSRVAHNSDYLNLPTMFVLVPIAVLDEVVARMQAEQRKKTGHYIKKMFARAMHLPPKLCMRRSNLFELQELLQCHVLLTMGNRPPLGSAQLALVVEGQVCLVGPRPADHSYQRYREFRDGSKTGIAPWCESVPPGTVLGQAAIYGLPYAHTAVVASEKALVLSLNVKDYLETILHHSGILDSAAANAHPQQLKTEGPRKDANAGSLAEARRLIENRERLLRVAHDAEVLKVSEWKSVQLKAPLPRQQIPRGINVEPKGRRSHHCSKDCVLRHESPAWAPSALQMPQKDGMWV